ELDDEAALSKGCFRCSYVHHAITVKASSPGMGPVDRPGSHEKVAKKLPAHPSGRHPAGRNQSVPTGPASLTAARGRGSLCGYVASESVQENRVLANTSSANKRIRQEQKRNLRNRAQRSRLKTAIKKVQQATDPQAAAEAFKETAALLDRLATRRLIHPNKAARKKSQLARKLNQMTSRDCDAARSLQAARYPRAAFFVCAPAAPPRRSGF